MATGLQCEIRAGKGKGLPQAAGAPPQSPLSEPMKVGNPLPWGPVTFVLQLQRLGEAGGTPLQAPGGEARLRHPSPPRAWPEPCPSCPCCRTSLTAFPSPQTPRQIQKMSPQHASVKGNLHGMREGLKSRLDTPTPSSVGRGVTVCIRAMGASQEGGGGGAMRGKEAARGGQRVEGGRRGCWPDPGSRLTS